MKLPCSFCWLTLPQSPWWTWSWSPWLTFCHGDHGQGGKMVKMTKIQPVCRLTSDLLTEHSPHPSYHAARIHTEKKTINILAWVTTGSFSFCSMFPSMTFLTRAIVLTFVPIDKETNDPISGIIIYPAQIVQCTV